MRISIQILLQIAENFGNKLNLFSPIKPQIAQRLHLLEGNQIINDNLASAELLNNYFIDAVEDLDIDMGLHISNTGNTLTPVDKCIEMYRGRPSILQINEIGYNVNAFSFKPVCIELINRLINNIDSSKAYQKGNIPPKILKDNVDICAKSFIRTLTYVSLKEISLLI